MSEKVEVIEEVEEEVEETDQETLSDEDIANLSDEELAAKLTGEEGDISTDEDESGTSKETDEAKESEESEEKEEEPEKDEAKDKDVDKSKDESDEGPTREELLAELAKTKEQLGKKEEFAQHQSTRAGEAEKALREFEERQTELTSKKTEESEGEKKPLDLDNARKEVDEIVSDAVAKNKADTEAAYEAAVEKDRLMTEFVTAKTLEAVPDFKDYVEDIAEMALEDGADEKKVQTFKDNPFGTTDMPNVLINYAKRAMDRRALKELQEKVKKKDDSPDVVAKKIANAANRKAGLNSGASESSKEDNAVELTDEQIANLTDKELETYIKRQRKEG